jgi:integrase
MVTENSSSGTQIASEMRLPSPSAQSVAIVPNTIADLLSLLEAAGTKGMPMLRTTSGVLATYLSTSTDRLTIQSVFDAKDSFRPYLVGRKYAENSIRTYVNHAKILIKSASSFGWGSVDTVPPEWQEVLAQAKSQKIRKNIVKYLAKIRPTPSEVTTGDASRWMEEKIRTNSSMPMTDVTVDWLFRTLRKLGVAGPGIKMAATKYQIPLAEFPNRLRSEVVALMKWKQAEFAPGRPSDGQHRAVTAKNLESTICRLYGYALHIRGESEIKCLADLVKESIVTGFVEWRINERRNGGYGVSIGLGMLRAALRHHPAHSKIELAWCDRLMESLPVEPESARRARKAEKFIDYSVLEGIPALISLNRLKLGGASAKVSHLIMQELLMLWLLILPWRQRNIREMRVSGPEPNIFKNVISPFNEMKKPQWVLKEEKENPSARFWQFRFKSHETKNGSEVHALLPKQLVPLMENYLTEHRPSLLQGNYCDTLFVTRLGGAPSSRFMTDIVRELTIRYAGRQITPHRFRDIVAYAWLDAHPEDYLRLSKLLWHRNVSTTIQIYGARFNESNGVCAMEAWLDERAAKSK